MTRSTFVSLHDVAPEILLDIRYASANNFMGRPVAGYEAARCLVTREAAHGLRAVAQHAASYGLRLKVFDGYRPRRAVLDFLAWSQTPDDASIKASYHPRIDKRELLSGGYIASESSHSRGSTVDLTLTRSRDGGAMDVDGPRLPDGELDMGTPFDFFDPRSHTFSDAVSPSAQRNRALLRDLMREGGFAGIAEEWWHFTLVNEPFPNRSFDFPITARHPVDGPDA